MKSKKLLSAKHIRFLFITCCLISLTSCSEDNSTASIHYVGGYLFDGDKFKVKDFSIKGGKFSFDSSLKTDKTVNIDGKYVIPPFGDAHTHNFDDIEQFDSIYQSYINEGTFYVQVLTNHYSRYEKIKDSLNKRGNIDVAFAHGGMTSTGGHPHAIYETSILGMGWRAMLNPENREKIRNSRIVASDAYYLMNSLEDVHSKWDEIISKRPSILKIYISNIKNRDIEIESGNIGTYGLSKQVAKAIIEKAIKSKIRVYAHIETVDDFIWALNNDVTYFAHMPGYGGGYGKTNFDSFIIPDSILSKASKKNVLITPTVSFAKYYAQAWNGKEMAVDTILLKEKQDFLRNELKRFQKAGIQLAFGADQKGSTLMEEINDIIALDAFENNNILSIITGSSKHIFPDRKIGEIREGYEASFLVLNNNPLEDIDNIKSINMRVKNGIKLN